VEELSLLDALAVSDEVGFVSSDLGDDLDLPA
jgi:hypothetical protein